MKTTCHSSVFGRSFPREVAPRRGFSLTELLVVILIIVVLASLSFVGVAKLREHAKSVTCASNLRQVAAGMMMYTADRNGKLPPLATIDPDTGKQLGIWTLVVARAGYLWSDPGQGPPPCGKGVWTCPSCDFMSNAYGGYGVVEASIMQYDDRRSTVNSKMGRSDMGSLLLANIPNPERTWLVGDVCQAGDRLNKGWYAIWSKPSRWGSGHAPAPRHGGRVNVCMIDGHIESLTLDELKNRDYTMDKP